MIHFVPHRERYITATVTNQLMLFKEIIAVYCENQMKHSDTRCVQNSEFTLLKRMVHIVTTRF
jgi:hypothetical protein